MIAEERTRISIDQSCSARMMVGTLGVKEEYAVQSFIVQPYNDPSVY